MKAAGDFRALRYTRSTPLRRIALGRCRYVSFCRGALVTPGCIARPGPSFLRCVPIHCRISIESASGPAGTNRCLNYQRKPTPEVTNPSIKGHPISRGNKLGSTYRISGINDDLSRRFKITRIGVIIQLVGYSARADADPEKVTTFL